MTEQSAIKAASILEALTHFKGELEIITSQIKNEKSAKTEGIYINITNIFDGRQYFLSLRNSVKEFDLLAFLKDNVDRTIKELEQELKELN